MQTLKDCLDHVQRVVEEAHIEGLLQEEEAASKHAYPHACGFTEEEKTELCETVYDYTEEIVTQLQNAPHWTAQHGEDIPLEERPFRIIAYHVHNLLQGGLLWERYVRTA